MSEHTAGPWHIGIKPGPWHIGIKPGPIVYGPLGEQIADMRNAMVFNDEHKANIRLIASAPDLLAACQLAAAKCRLCKGSGQFEQTLSGGVKRLADCDLCAPYRNAIRKATEL